MANDKTLTRAPGDGRDASHVGDLAASHRAPLIDCRAAIHQSQ
jgi:hypothetical protein